METKEAPKRKYKKHKQGFKIAVDHKLNTRFIDENNLSPLYVEVRVKGQRTFLKSRFQCHLLNHKWEEVASNIIVKQCFEYEKKEIVSSILSNEKLFSEEFSLSEWYGNYSRRKGQSRFDKIYAEYSKDQLLKFIQSDNSNNIDKNRLKKRIDEYTSNWAAVDDVELLYAAGHLNLKDVAELLDIINSFQSISNDFKAHGLDLFDKCEGYFSIYSSLVEHDIDSGFFDEAVSFYRASVLETQSFLEKAQKIKKMTKIINAK